MPRYGLTGEVPVINNLLVGAPTNFSMPLVKAGFLTTFHRVADGNCQNATIVAGLPLHLSSKSNGRGRGGVNSRQRFLGYTTSIMCGASCQQSASVSQFMPWIFVEELQQAKNAHSAQRKDFPLWKVTTANCPTSPLQSRLRGGMALMPR